MFKNDRSEAASCLVANLEVATFTLRSSPAPFRWSIASSQDCRALTFQCTTSAAVEEGEEALISYGNNPSWNYLLFYGFVPLRNVHDRVVLFQNLEEAVNWFLDRFPPKVGPLA